MATGIPPHIDQMRQLVTLGTKMGLLLDQVSDSTVEIGNKVMEEIDKKFGMKQHHMNRYPQ